MSKEDDRKRRKRRYGDDDDEGKGGSGSGSAPMKDEDDKDAETQPPSNKKRTMEEDINARLSVARADTMTVMNDYRQNIVDVPITADYELTLFRMIYEYTQMASDTANIVKAYNSGFEEKIVTEPPIMFHMPVDETKGFIWAAGTRLKDFRVTSFEQKTGTVKLEAWYNGARFGWDDLIIQSRVPDATNPADYIATKHSFHFEGFLNLDSYDHKLSRVFLRDGRLFLITKDEVDPFGSHQTFKDSITVKDLRNQQTKSVTVPHHMSELGFSQFGMTNDSRFIWTNNTERDPKRQYSEVFDRLSGKELVRIDTSNSHSNFAVLDTIRGTRHLVMQRFAGFVEPGFDIIDINSKKTIRTIRAAHDVYEKIKYLYRAWDVRVVNKGIWATRGNELIFIEFPQNDDLVITKVHTKSFGEDVLVRLCSMAGDDGSICVFTVNTKTGEITVSIAHPRVVVYTLSRKH